MTRSGPHRGMTLIEMMMALAIVGLLTAAALTVATNLSRSRRLDATRTTDAAVAESIGGLLAADIRNATAYHLQAGGIELQARASLDAETFEMRHLPVTVIYEIREIADARWLVRRQQADGKDVLSELVCRDAAAVTLRPIDGDSKRSSGTWRPLPACVEVAVTFEDSNRPAVRGRFRTR